MNYFIHVYTSHHFTPHRKIWTQLIDLVPNVWLHSSVGRVSHQYYGGHGFKSRWSSDFFRLLLSNCLNWKIYCDDLPFFTFIILCVENSQMCGRKGSWVLNAPYSWLNASVDQYPGSTLDRQLNCHLLNTRLTLDQHLGQYLVNTQSTSQSTVGQELANLCRHAIKCQLIHLCHSSGDQLMTSCQSDHVLIGG